MIYKNYISDKNLSGLDIYISIFLLVFIITVGRFYYYYLLLLLLSLLLLLLLFV